MAMFLDLIVDTMVQEAKATGLLGDTN